MAIAVCEKHRLRYDAESQSGCVICRREAAAASGTAPVPPPPSGAPSTVASAVPPAPRSQSSGSPDSLIQPLLVATSIWLVSALLLFATHQQLAAAYLADEEDQASALGMDGAGDPGLGVEPAPGTAAGQTDAVLEEIRALQGDEPAAAGDGAPPATPGSEQLAPEDAPMDDDEPSLEPVEIELDDPGGGAAQP